MQVATWLNKECDPITGQDFKTDANCPSNDHKCVQNSQKLSHSLTMHLLKVSGCFLAKMTFKRQCGQISGQKICSKEVTITIKQDRYRPVSRLL
jgi:hypothetical protein